MKSKNSRNVTSSEQEHPADDMIARYADAQSPEFAAVCRTLRAEIDRALPKATSKIWHAIPVWFIGENPVVGYKVTAKNVGLMFWSGQLFDEPELAAVGKFKAAEIKYADASAIDVPALRRWLRKAVKEIWDYKQISKKKAD